MRAFLHLGALFDDATLRLSGGLKGVGLKQAEPGYSWSLVEVTAMVIARCSAFENLPDRWIFST